MQNRTKNVCLPIFTLMAGLSLGALSYHAVSAQQTPPTKSKGLTSKILVKHDLGPQLPALQGYYLQMRLVTIEPGGHGRLHSHEQRPVTHYILQGTFSSCRPDGTCTDIQEGQTLAEGEDVRHWPENRGTKPAISLAVEIKKKP